MTFYYLCNFIKNTLGSGSGEKVHVDLNGNVNLDLFAEVVLASICHHKVANSLFVIYLTSGRWEGDSLRLCKYPVSV